MSVALTEQSVRDRRKTVTRRLGWRFLKAGDRLTLCPKVQGRNGAPLERIAEVEVVSVRREWLTAITAEDVAREGFPEFTTVTQFVEFFCQHMRCEPEVEVTRIEWRYLDEAVV